jgi:uncharacterized membrane protein
MGVAMTFISKMSRGLLFFCVFLALSGGFYFRSSNGSFEVSQMDLFGVLLLIALLFLSLSQRPISFVKWAPSAFADALYRLLERPSSKWLFRGFVFVFGFLFLGHWMRHAAFETHMYDMACLHQPLFYPFEEALFHCNTCRMNTQFAEHMVWTLIPISLLTMLAKSDVLIFAIQSLVVAVPLWIFIVHGPLKNHRLHGFWFFVLFALMRPLRDGMIFDFREDALGFGFMLLALTAFYNSRWIWGVVLTALVMLTKENFPAVTLLFGLVLLFEKRLPLTLRQRWISGLSIVALSFGIFALYNKLLIPYFMGPSEAKNNILRYFPGMGSTMSEFVINVLLNPIDFILRFGGQFFTVHGLKYILMLVLPIAIWGWRAWIWTLPGIAMGALNLLSSIPSQSSGSFHYEFIIIPFLMMACALGISKVAETKTFEQMRSTWVWALVLPLCVAGRGPVFELTDRLIYQGERIPAHITVKSWQPEGPMAGNTFTVSQLTRFKEIRLVRYPKTSPPESQDELIRALVQFNGPISITDQGRDIRDARDYALLLGEPWENALIQELLKIGGQIKSTARTASGEDFAVWIQTPEPPLETWCREKLVCTEGQR